MGPCCKFLVLMQPAFLLPLPCTMSSCPFAQNEKRQLETNIVVEERLRNPAPLERAASQETVDDEGEDDDQDSGSGSGASETEDDLFYDCDPSQVGLCRWFAQLGADLGWHPLER